MLEDDIEEYLQSWRRGAYSTHSELDKCDDVSFARDPGHVVGRPERLVDQDYTIDTHNADDKGDCKDSTEGNLLLLWHTQIPKQSKGQYRRREVLRFLSVSLVTFEPPSS